MEIGGPDLPLLPSNLPPTWLPLQFFLSGTWRFPEESLRPGPLEIDVMLIQNTKRKGPIFIGRDTPSLRAHFSPLDSISDVWREDRVVYQLMFAIEALLESIRVPVQDLKELCEQSEDCMGRLVWLQDQSCWFVEVDLSDIRKDVQCPICLGIIRKTRTVMECLHRFCRECIDKSMRLGNNECPVCRTHCASRRSLRDDLNFDALIAALYPNVDSYEEEEFALREENERRNKQVRFKGHLAQGTGDSTGAGNSEKPVKNQRIQRLDFNCFESMETPIRLSETMQSPKPMPNAQEQVAETPVFQAVPVQPATFQQPIVGFNGQGSNLQAMQQVFPPPSVHLGYFGGGSVFQSMADHALGNQFYTPGTVFGGAQTMMPNPMYAICGNSGQGTQMNPNSVPMFQLFPYDNLTPLEKPTPYKEGGKGVTFTTFIGFDDRKKVLSFLQKFDKAYAEGNFTEASKLQQSIAETLERQSDAITRRCTTSKITASTGVRKSQTKFRDVEHQNKGKQSQNYRADDEDYMEEFEQTAAPETATRDRRTRRRKRETTTLQLEATDDEQGDVQANKSSRLNSSKTNDDAKGDTSGGNVGRLEGLVTWARAGSRSTARYGNLNNSNNRLIARATMLLEALSAATQMERDIEFDVHLILQPFVSDDDDDNLPSLDKPHICCPANVTVQHVCEFVVNRLPIDPDEQLELILGSNEGQDLYMDSKPNHSKQKGVYDGTEGFKVPEILHPQATLGQIHEILWHCHGNLVLLYRRRI
ncbi:hypothetical protein L7F22_025585 [Adiantum nelumboides]|nr:hypothetical protein [Adiantum nelumboides]